MSQTFSLAACLARLHAVQEVDSLKESADGTRGKAYRCC